MLNFIFFSQFSPEQLVTPAVHEPASEDDQTSHHQKFVEDGYCEHEKLTAIESIAVPQRSVYKFYLISFTKHYFIVFL
jgi:hypothetical protein